MSDARAKPAVVIDDLHVRRGTTDIIQGVSLRIESGSCTALLGPNGCGKTTLARCITGHMFMTQGSVRVLGETIGHTDVRKLRQRIGVVSPMTDSGDLHQAGAVVDADLSTTDAVITGYFATVGLYDIPTEQQREHARHLLQMVGLGHRMDHRFGLLSTGEQRRAVIARALVHMPELLILDEPTAGLDVAGREQVLAAVEMVLTAANPPAVLMITHHVEELSPRTCQVLLMRHGQIIARGEPAQIITPEHLSAMFGCKVFVRTVHGRHWLEVLPEAWLDLIPQSHRNATNTTVGGHGVSS